MEGRRRDARGLRGAGRGGVRLRLAAQRGRGARASGAFSRFPDVDRTLAVLGGRMRLTVERQAPVELRAKSPALSFDGDAETSADVVEPVTDANLMTRRGVYRGTLDWVEIDRLVPLVEQYAQTILLAIDPVALPSSELNPLEAIWLGPGCSTVTWPIGETACALVARIWHQPLNPPHRSSESLYSFPPVWRSGLQGRLEAFWGLVSKGFA